MSLHVCTVVTPDHLARARVLAWSLREHHPGVQVTALVGGDAPGQANTIAYNLNGVSVAAATIVARRNAIWANSIFANVRLGIDAAPHVAAFLNVRYLGGGAEGASEEGDLRDYSSNWLQFMIVSLGVELR